MIDRETRMLCPSCGNQCSEEAHFCAHCRSPMTSYASTAPFESIFAEGAVYRSAISEPRKPIILIGIWLIFLPMLLVGIVTIISAFLRVEGDISYLDAKDLFVIISGFGMLLIGAIALITITKNYRKS